MGPHVRIAGVGEVAVRGRRINPASLDASNHPSVAPSGTITGGGPDITGFSLHAAAALSRPLSPAAVAPAAAAAAA